MCVICLLFVVVCMFCICYLFEMCVPYVCYLCVIGLFDARYRHASCLFDVCWVCVRCVPYVCDVIVVSVSEADVCSLCV